MLRDHLEDLISAVLLNEKHLRFAAGRGYPPGTVRTWNGKDFRKERNGTWVYVTKGRAAAAAAPPAAPAPAPAPAAPAAAAAPARPATPTIPAPTPEQAQAIMAEPVVPPSSGIVYKPDPLRDGNRDGVADAARVGLCGSCTVPPMHDIPRLPNLTEDERDVETRFAEAAKADMPGMVAEYRKRLEQRQVGDAPHFFSTDDAKVLSPDWNPPTSDKPTLHAAKARYNVVVHQTSNAIAKAAFIQKLDELAELPEGDPKRSVLVTSGGVAAGKGYALDKVPETRALGEQVGAVWDSAGEQNGTENPWVLAEAQKRGLKATFVYVDSDPKQTWENPARGVVQRAREKGRMVDARVFADSYALGARNFKGFKENNEGAADFVILSSRGDKPVRVEDVPEVALRETSEQIYARASANLDTSENLTPEVRRGGSIGRRIWGPATAQETFVVWNSRPLVEAAPVSGDSELVKTLEKNFKKNWGKPTTSYDTDRDTWVESQKPSKKVPKATNPPPPLNPDGSIKRVGKR